MVVVEQQFTVSLSLGLGAAVVAPVLLVARAAEEACTAGRGADLRSPRTIPGAPCLEIMPIFGPKVYK